jgi:hypothetical protein
MDKATGLFAMLVVACALALATFAGVFQADRPEQNDNPASQNVVEKAGDPPANGTDCDRVMVPALTNERARQNVIGELLFAQRPGAGRDERPVPARSRTGT